MCLRTPLLAFIKGIEDFLIVDDYGPLRKAEIQIKFGF